MKYLIRIFVFSLLISLWLPIFSVNAQQGMENRPVWLSASGQKSSNLSNKQQVNSLSENTLDVLITFPGVWAEMQNENGVDFTRIWQDEYSSYREPGQPVLPGKAYNILIPYGAQVEILNQTVTSEKISLSDYSLPATITPAQIQVSKSEPPPPWTEPDPQHYSSPNTFPQNWYELQSTFQIRDYTILPLWINPVRYSPGKGEIEILEQIELRLTWQTSSVDGTRNAVVSDSPSFDRLVRQLVINPPDLSVYNTKAETGEGYLIITPDEFEDALRPFVDMKENQGYEVSLTKLSEIDTIYEDHSVTSIQNYIKSIVPPPVYLLLVGDTNLIPGFNLTNYSGFAYSFDKTTDLYYGTLDDDFIPDIAVGRLPVRNIGDLTTVINKISSYNYMGFQRWQSNTSFIASCDYYAITEESHNDVMEKRTSPLGYPTFFPVNQDLTGGDHLYCYTFSARTNDILNSINNK
ncbi:MAG TPA: C25 family cysteine peptidase, partial [Anaerolineaceae bacterium]|nr:C25 family cysteine peptidase [Anaerolineaceae bacterium]